MATSLQRQLANLRATRTNELDLKAQKAAYSKSLLFEPSVAASQSLDGLFQICYEGFEELCDLDSRFLRYQRSLFNPTFKSQDRSLMTAAENQDLSRLLDSCMIQLSPRLLFKPAQKAVEWLVRRFKIHELDTENFVLAFLPYHPSELFATVLSILPTTLPPSLRFLGRYTNTLQRPPREAFVQAFIQHPSFFTAFGNHVLKVAQAGFQSHTLVSLWATVTVQGIDGILSASASSHSQLQRQREDDLCARLFPILSSGLALRRAPEHILGCYMVVVVLVNNTYLSNETLGALMETVSKSLTSDTRYAGIACLAQIAERRSLSTLPQAVASKLLKMTHLNSILLLVSKQQSVQNLVLGLLGPYPGLQRAKYQDTINQISRAISDHRLLPRAAGKEVGIALGKHASPPADSQVQTLRAKRQRQALRQASDISEGAIGSDASTSLASLCADEASSEVQDRLQRRGHHPGFQQEEMPNELVSFLSRSTSAVFARLMAQLHQLDQSSEGGDTFFEQHPIFASDKGRIRAISFLLRSWCTGQSPAARTTALQRCEKIVQREQPSQDLCAFIVPYALLALNDQAQRTRAAASKLIVALTDILQANDPKVGAAEGLTMVFRDFYGEAPKLSTVESRTAVSAFCSILRSRGLEECIIDGSRIGQLLSELLGNAASRSSNRTDGKAQKFKTSHKDLVYRYMTGHASSSQDSTLTTFLIRLIVSVDKVAGKPRSQYLVEMLRRFVSTPKDDLASIFGEDVAPDEYTHAMFAIVHPRDEQSLSLLVQCATDVNGTTTEEVRSQALARLETLWPSLHGGTQDSVASSLLEASQAYGNAGSTSVGMEHSRRLLQSLPLRSHIIERILQDSLTQLTSDGHAGKRLRTESVSSAVPDSIVPLVDRVSFTLDLVQTNSSRVTLSVFHSLFELLTVIRTLATKTTSKLDYLLATNLECLSTTLQHLEADHVSPQLDLSVVRTDVLIDCVRATSSTQTRNSAFLLLSKLVRYNAQLVLHTVMPIFTLMTSTTARQSDDLSMHVVDTTVKSIIPPLCQKLQEQQRDIATSTADMLSAFATAFDHIPPDRRLQLFSLLATSLGPQDSLFAISACLVDQKPGDQEVIAFLSAMLRKFAPLTVMVTVDKYLAFVLSGLQQSSGLFQTLSKADYTGPEKERILSCHLRAVLTMLQLGDVQGRLQQDMKNETVAIDLHNLLSGCMEKAVSISHGSIGNAQLEAQQTISGLLFVFPFQHVAAAVEPLLEHRDMNMSRRVLATLEKRIRSIKKPTSDAVQSILSLLPRLASILSNRETVFLRKAALACMDCICDRFGKVDAGACVEAVQAISTSDCLMSDDTLVRTLSLQCFASTVENLGNDSIPVFGTATQAAKQCLEFAVSSNDERLHNACFALTSAIADRLPYLVSQSHLSDQLQGAIRSSMSRLTGGAEDARKHYLRLAAMKVDLALTLPAVQSVWSTALSSGQKAVEELNEIVRSSISARSKSELQRSSRAVADLLLLMLDLPRSMPAQPRSRNVTSNGHLESDIRQTVVAYVLKINDLTFRPFFARLVEWSSNALPPSDQDGCALRMRVMFEVMHSLSEALKSIFTTYFSNVVEHAVRALNNKTAAKSVGHSPKLAVFQALTSSFKYDQDDFWQAPARFDAVAGPLISQLATSAMDQVESYVAPCITELAADAATPESHKTMNTMLLKLLQSDHARTRLAAVECQQSLVGRLGDDWLANLPEMLPIINELQDDDDEKVERETHKWIKAIEEVLGESLSSMLQ